MTTTKTILSRVLFVMYLAAIGLICFISSSSVPDLPTLFLGIDVDKMIHFGMFLPFPIMAFLSFDHPSGKKLRNVLFIVVSMIVGVIIAGFTEVIQEYLPTREMDINDFIADSTGIALSSIFVLIVDLTRK